MTELDKPEGQELSQRAERMVVQAVHIELSGPLPPPQLLRQYNEVLPEGAERVVRVAEAQFRHRRSMESRAQIFTFVLALIVLVGGIALIALGNSPEGLLPLVAAIAGLGGLFLYREVEARRGEKNLLKEQ